MTFTEWGPQLRSSSAEEPRTLADATLRRLRRDIISGRLKPGEKIRAQELAKIYDVGNSPMREALFQLVSDGLVRSSGQRGFKVAELTRAELLDITHWRCELEPVALARSMENRSVEWEAELVSAMHTLRAVETDPELGGEEAADLWEIRHRDFHFTLYKRCGSSWLLRFCELLGENGERYRRAFVEYRRMSPRITDEHNAILAAVLEKRSDDAVNILRQHIRHAAELAETHLLGGTE